MDAKLRIKIDNRLLSIDIFDAHQHMTTMNNIRKMKFFLKKCRT